MRLKRYFIFLLLSASVASATTVSVGPPGVDIVKLAEAIFSGRVANVFVQVEGAEEACRKGLLKVSVEKAYKGPLESGQFVYIAADNQLEVGKSYIFLANGMREPYSDQCFRGDMRANDLVHFHLARRYQAAYEIVEHHRADGKRETLFLVPRCEPHYERLFATDSSVLLDFKDPQIKTKCPVKAGRLSVLENKINELLKMKTPWEEAKTSAR